MAEEPRTWPDLVGKSFEEAEAAIKNGGPDLQVRKVEPGQMVPRDLRPDRVFVYVDANGVVEKVPSIG